MNDKLRLLESSDIGWRALARDDERRGYAARIDWIDRRNADDAVTFRGYASVFDSPYDVAGLFTETVRAGAFSRSLRNDPKIHFLALHEGLPLASTQAGTLRLREDDHGLAVVASLDMRSPYAMSVVSAVERGDMDEMSFGFRVMKGGDAWNADYTQRELLAVSLSEVSTVPRGANPDTSGLIDGDLINLEKLENDDRAAAAKGFARSLRLLEQQAELSGAPLR